MRKIYTTLIFTLLASLSLFADQIVAPNATDLIAEASAYMQLESTVYDIAKTVHAHPTVSEVFMEAGMDAAFKAIHK